MPFVFFVPILILFVLPILIGGIIIVRLAVKGVAKQKNSIWAGTLIDKSYFEKEDMDSSIKEDHYTLTFQSDDGEIRKLGVAKKFYDQFHVGDRVQKDQGKIFPAKIS